MKTQFIRSAWHSIDTDALLIPLFESETLAEGLAAEVDHRLEGLLSELDNNKEWSGKIGETVTVHRPPSLPVGRLILTGLGREEDFDAGILRESLMRAMRKVKAYRLNRVAVFARSGAGLPLTTQAAVEGIILGSFGVDAL